VEESADDLFFVEAVPGGKSQHVDAAQLAILTVADQGLDRGEDLGIGRIAERAEQGLRVVHGHATYAHFGPPPGGDRTKFRTTL
jgi:hypothetical protein